jgi:hypothetical protein
MDRMPARDQRPANTFEEIGLRTLEKQKRARNQITFASRIRTIAALS